MDLSKKLARLKSPGPAKAPAVTAYGSPVDGGALPPDFRASSTRPTDRPVFETEPTEHGPLHVRETNFSDAHHHGQAPVRAALDADARTVCTLALDEGLRDFDPRRMLLLDTETTGLAGGTGTLPFVVGIGEFEGDRLRVRQLVLRRPGEERPILARLAERIAGASCLVTYNGKTFDWPLLRNRFVMNRMKVPAAPPHLDLLHCARRVFKHRAGGAKLTQLEEDVLGHKRVGDIPGSAIPELYFRYLKVKDDRLIEPVLEHNAHDMVLLAAMLGHLVREYRDRLAEDPRDQLGYAQLAHRADDSERALFFAKAAACARDPELQGRALFFAGSLLRRRGQVQEAIPLLQRALLLCSGHELAQIHLALAKIYEHRLRDHARAAEHARRAVGVESDEDYRLRLNRLREKVTPPEPSPTLPLPLADVG